jgi:hypothetical protein
MSAQRMSTRHDKQAEVVCSMMFESVSTGSLPTARTEHAHDDNEF